MKVIKLNNLKKQEYKRILSRSTQNNPEVFSKAKKIIQTVKENGDSIILKKYQGRYDTKRYPSTLVSTKEIQEAYKEVPKLVLTAFKQMVKNISAVHQAQLKTRTDPVVTPEQGIKVWREWRAIEKVGLYIPGGRAVYPSSVFMTAIPAIIAGCKEIVICSPPGENGKIPSPTLVAADMLGLTKIYKVGGAEAIAAMTFGTRSIPNVYKIFGAGNAYVTAAKMLALETISIDMPAGPSEIFIIADETANPSYIAADLLADGEHGDDSACVLITTSKDIARQTIKEIKKQLPKLSTKKRIEESISRYGLFALVDSLDEAIMFSNNYAPEHLEIMTKNPKSVVEKITNAGSVFLGDWTTKAAGDYATGANHILPTGRFAKMYPPLGVDSFGKWMQVQIVESKAALSTIRKTMEVLGKIEKLPAHGNSATIRFIK